ncbi:MAG: hypothetical protein WAW13_02170 [Minisyncoccia bacterium]
MSQTKKCILLNTGVETRTAFEAGLTDSHTERYHSKKIVLHINEAGVPNFICKNDLIDFTNSFVFMRLRGTDPHFCGMMYAYFAHHNIPVNDPINRSHPYSAEKISQMLFLSLGGIRIPETIIFREESYAANRDYILSHTVFPLVYKIDGSKGRDVHIAHTIDELDTLVQNKRPRRLALIQPFIENTFDTRTLVAFDEVLGSIKRTRASGYLNNIAQGATASPMELTQTEKAVAQVATKVCGIDFGGVDMIHTPEGPIVLEVNKSPQIGGFESVHQFKVFTKIAELMQKKFGA